MAYLPDGLPTPMASPDGLDTGYYEAAARHELVVQKCDDCGTFQWGPEWICHKCRSFNMGWVQVEPKGKIYSWERVWYPVHPAVAESLPYVVALVELPQAGNVRMIGNLLGDATEPIVIGADVEAVFEDHPGEFPYTLVQWQRT